MNKDDLLKMEKLVAECEYFVKKYKPLVKYEKSKTYAQTALENDVTEWLKTAKPGDIYNVPTLRIGRKAEEKILHEAGLNIVSIVKDDNLYFEWVLQPEPEPLPF